jgi:hypothetical protein
MMKLSFLLALGACALAGNVKADNPQIVIQSTHAEEDARAAAGWEHAHAMDRYFATLAQQALVPHDPNVRAAYNDWLKRNRLHNEELQRLYAVDQLSEGDPVPEIGDLYDSEPMIKIYLRDSGYTEISDAEVTKIHDYMRANHIRHVSQLGQ